MFPDLIKQLEQFIKTAQLKCAEFNIDLSDESKKDIAIDFQSKILNVLDYSYNNFPVSGKKSEIYYPRPNPQETKTNYFARIRDGKTATKTFNDFLLFCFQANLKHNEAISYILGKVKHEKTNEFGENVNAELKAKFKSNHPEPFKRNPDGSLEIGGFIKLGPLASAHISHSTFKTPKGTIEIESLEFGGGKFEGDMIILKNSEKRSFVDWANNCINICEDIINYLK
ncbi:hypothetical protein A2814_02985 [Candidatus Nomurabacteria bacterium RIFCSPHIGHO2_01_FULL_38_19]|uniref:Uncharacterized protein n=1 Tax=Candidatus Nomurabacteria bacterium RIFCSPHIGHO2_01_FULL_38_19 TaxID=1801732 RepID=A0A1F6UQG6_9BACT|nr:MAG: hypothetical protein A2814_02985 [Candidatus Nomurabacteria bacterium RIFCSPHIGHO2_01_FULL_38_19]